MNSLKSGKILELLFINSTIYFWSYLFCKVTFDSYFSGSKTEKSMNFIYYESFKCLKQ